jgi:hypothetical protein
MRRIEARYAPTEQTARLFDRATKLRNFIR